VVDHPDPPPEQVGHCLVKVGHFKGDVVQARPAPFQEAPDHSRPGRFEQLHERITGWQHALDEPVRMLLRHAGQAQQIRKPRRRVIAPVREGNMVQAGNSPRPLRLAHVAPSRTKPAVNLNVILCYVSEISTVWI
jgi:hypothetical protein